MMPKSTKVSLPSASTNRFPGCMSAWKKPSRSAWRRKVWITACDRCLRSKPLASSVARSCSGVPSIHSSVSTSLAVRSQSTDGTRKSGSALVFSAISDSAAASSRRSISMRDRAAQGGDGLDHAQPPRLRRQAFGLAGREGEGFEIDAEAPLDVGPQHLHGDGLAALGRDDFGAMHLRDRGRGDRRAERRVGPPTAACRARPTTTASASACGNGAILSCSDSRSRASATPTTSGRVARNCPSLT